MTPEALLEALLELANEIGLEVRAIGSAPAPGSETPPSSGVCRVRGKLWVVLSTADPLAQQIEAIGRGVLAQAGPELEDRFLPPALRECLAGLEDST